jgi:hypothetical protein
MATPKDFIRLASGYSINPHLVSHIDFTRPGAVMVHVGASAIEATGDDADTLRDLFDQPGETAKPTPGTPAKAAAKK